jgi:hypothetical protein
MPDEPDYTESNDEPIVNEDDQRTALGRLDVKPLENLSDTLDKLWGGGNK